MSTQRDPQPPPRRQEGVTVKRGALRRFGRDVLVGLIGFGVVFSLVYLAGMAFEPPDYGVAVSGPGYGINLSEEGNAVGVVEVHPSDEGEVTASEENSGASLLAELGTELDNLDIPAAIVQVSGAIEERLVFNDAQLRGFGAATLYDLETGEPNPDAEGPFDLRIKYSGRSGALALVLREVSVGVPKTDRMDVILSVGPKSWYTHPGDCTLELLRFDWTTVLNDHGFEDIIPVFTGVVTCNEVADVRSDEVASFSAVFNYFPLVGD